MMVTNNVGRRTPDHAFSSGCLDPTNGPAWKPSRHYSKRNELACHRYLNTCHVQHPATAPCFELASTSTSTALPSSVPSWDIGLAQDRIPGQKWAALGSFRCLFSSVSGYHAIIGSHACTVRLPPRRSICSIRTPVLSTGSPLARNNYFPRLFRINYPYLPEQI